MASSSELRRKRNQYYTLLSNTNSVYNYVAQSYNEIENAAKIGEHFSINDDSADGGEIKSVQGELENVKNYLNGTIIPEINNKINSLTREIAQAEAEEERERQRELELEREREQRRNG